MNLEGAAGAGGGVRPEAELLRHAHNLALPGDRTKFKEGQLLQEYPEVLAIRAADCQGRERRATQRLTGRGRLTMFRPARWHSLKASAKKAQAPTPGTQPIESPPAGRR